MNDSSIVVQYIGKGLFSAHSSEYPDCHAVADSEDGARAAVEEAVRNHLSEKHSKPFPSARTEDPSQ
jgi:predicted RNase H-like HicB family nuclease